MASGTFTSFYELKENDNGTFELLTGANLTSSVVITEVGNPNGSFVTNETVSLAYTDPVVTLPGILRFYGLYDNNSGYLVFNENFEKFYMATNLSVSVLDPATITTGSTPVCFLSGTRISVPGGEIAVEDLKIGDAVVTANGVQKLKFLARTTNWIGALRAAGRMPIRIAAGAFGQCGPLKDLWVSPSHGILLGGNLVEAGALCNGTSVSQPDDLDQLQVTYYNLEFENHEIIQANGLSVESYYANWRSTGLSRTDWDNYCDYVALYGEGEPMKELELPRIPFARQLPAEIRQLAGLPDSAQAEEALYALS